MVRFVLLLIVLGLLSGCAEESLLKRDSHEPVAGEATPAPQTGPHGGWAW
jgi:hypothetical protein